MQTYKSLKFNKSQLYEYFFVIPWVVVFTIFSAVMQPDIVKFQIGISYEVLLLLFLICNVTLFLFVILNHNLKYLKTSDIFIVIIFLLQTSLIFKNYAISGDLRNTWLIYSFLFYFIGRSCSYNSFFKLNYFLKGFIISAIIHVLASVLLKIAFFTGNENLILVGADITGFKWHGYFINRATGFFSSPLTLSGFLLIALMLLTYFILEQKRFYYVYIFILIGFLLTMSRGSFIAFIIYNFIIFCLKPRLAYNKIVLITFFIVAIIMLTLVKNGMVSFERLFSSAALSVSYDTRLSNHSYHLEQWAVNPASLLFGDSSNQLGIDSDFLNYVFNLGLIVSLFYGILLVYLSVFHRRSVFGTYLSAGFAAKIVDSMLSGSSLGPPSLFAVMYLMGLWVNIASNSRKWSIHGVK